MTQMTQIAQPWSNTGILLSKHSSFIKLFSCYAIIRFTDVEWVVSNRSFGLRKDFWDRHGAKIATRQKVIYGERLFDVFWKLYDTLIIPIWLKFISDFVYLYITKQHVCGTCFIAPYMALFHVLTMGRRVCVFFEEAESWVGVNRNVAKSWNQVNKLVQLFHVFDTFKKPDFGERSTIFITYD